MGCFLDAVLITYILEIIIPVPVPKVGTTSTVPVLFQRLFCRARTVPVLEYSAPICDVCIGSTSVAPIIPVC